MVQDLDTGKFIDEKILEIQNAVGDGTAINALSGGVDSSVVTMLGHKALGSRLRTLFIQNGLMREGEPETVAEKFQKLGVKVEIIDARTAKPSRLAFEVLEKIASEILEETPEVVSVTYNIATKPPSTIEAV